MGLIVTVVSRAEIEVDLSLDEVIDHYGADEVLTALVEAESNEWVQDNLDIEAPTPSVCVEDYEMMASENRYMAQFLDKQGFDMDEIAKIATGQPVTTKPFAKQIDNLLPLMKDYDKASLLWKLMKSEAN